MLSCPATRASIVLLLCALLPSCSCGDEGDLNALTRILVVDRDVVDFGEVYVGGRRAASITITNEGTGPARLDDPSIDDDAFVATGVPEGVAAGAQATFTIEMRPTRAAELSAALVVDNDADAPLVIALRGVGLAQPDCDDDNECTDESFDPIGETCTRTDRDNEPCDDDNACTDGDRCAQGTCAGQSVTCADGASCTVDACDPTAGCVFIPDHDVCADDDPCTIDTCDGSALFGTGCVSAPAPDGTLCGGFVPCETIELCLSQLCVEVDIPDGAPCADGNACTADDVCTEGVCAGTPIVTTDAVLQSETFRYVGAPPDPFGSIAERQAALVGDVLVVVDRSVHVLATDTFAPVGHLDGTHIGSAREPFVRPTGGRLVFRDDVDLRVRIVDISTADSPTVIELAGLDTDSLDIAGGDAERILICNGIELVAFDWQGVLIDSLGPTEFCVGRPRAAGNLGIARGALGATSIGVFRLDADPDVPTSVLTLSANSLTAKMDGDLAAILGTNTADGEEPHSELYIVDLADPAAPVVTEIDYGISIIGSFVLRRPWLYFAAGQDVRRVDVSVPSAPVIDTWRIDQDLNVIDADADIVVLQSKVVQGWQVASAIGGGVHVAAPLRFGRGGFDTLVSAGSEIVGAAVDGVSVFTDATADDPFPLTMEFPAGATSVFFEAAGGARGFYAAPDVRDAHGAAAGPLSLGRADRRVSLLGEGDAYLVREGDEAAEPLVIELPDGVDGLHSVALDGCFGAAVTLCSFPCAGPQLFVLSACEPAGSIAVTNAVTLELTDPDAIVSGSIDGTHATFLAISSAVLFDVVTALPIEVEVPELEDSVFASASYDDGMWLIVATYADGVRPARAILFDTSSGAAVRVTSFDVGVPPTDDGLFHIDIARRALAIVEGLAYVSDWDPTQPPSAGHSIVIYDLATEPPTVLDVVPLASEPTALVAREAGLVVGRIDGVSVIAPVCAP